MPITTRNKRSSAINVGSPWRGLLPAPDGAIDQADRQHAGFYYSGISASPVPSPPLVIVPASGITGATDTSYFVVINDAYANRLPDVRELYGLQVAQAVGTVGAVTFSIPGSYSENFLKKDGLIEIWRAPINGAPYLLFNKVFFLRRRRLIISGGQETWKLTAYDPNFILSSPSGQRGRIVAYAAGSAEADVTDFADDMAKQIVRDNLGAAAGTGRDISALLSVQADKSLGPSISKAFSNRVITPVLNEICQASISNGTYLAWDIVCTQPPYNGSVAFEFQTFINQRGIDRRPSSGDSLQIGVDHGNLDDVEIDEDWSEETTWARAGGEGRGAERPYRDSGDAARLGESPYARREEFLDLTNVSNLTTLDDEIKAVLRAGTPRPTYSGTLISRGKSLFDLDWGYGDYIGAQAKGRSFDARADAMVITFDRDNGEQIQSYLKGENVTV